MLGLNQKAAWFRRSGQKNGKPNYSVLGTTFPCRIQPTDEHTLARMGISSSDSVTVYAKPFAIRTGDRIVLGGQRAYVAREVIEEYGFRGVHHLKIIALGDAME